MTNDLHGGSAPKPPEFNALGESRGAGKKKGGKHRAPPLRHPPTSALRLLSSSGLILRVGRIIITGFYGSKEGRR